MEFVTVRHPDIEGTAEVSRMAFDATYAEKGWQLVDEDPPLLEQAIQQPVEQPAEQAPEPPVEQPADDVTPEPPTADSVTAEAPTPAPEV